MQLKNIMSTNVERIHKDVSVTEAAQKMKALDVGMLPVYDGDRLVGMITDRDITLRVAAAALDPAKIAVQEAMTAETIYCFEDQTVQEAARMMEQHQIRRLIILNRDKRLVGIVSLGDLATHTGSKRAAGEALESISQSA